MVERLVMRMKKIASIKKYGDKFLIAIFEIYEGRLHDSFIPTGETLWVDIIKLDPTVEIHDENNNAINRTRFNAIEQERIINELAKENTRLRKELTKRRYE